MDDEGAGGLGTLRPHCAVSLTAVPAKPAFLRFFLRPTAEARMVGLRSPLRRTVTYQQCCSGCYQRTGWGRKETKATARDKRDRQAGHACAHAAVPVHGTSHPHLQSSGARWWHACPQGQGRGRPQRSQDRDPSSLVREQGCAGQKRPQPQRPDRHCGLTAHSAHGSRWAACLPLSRQLL